MTSNMPILSAERDNNIDVNHLATSSMADNLFLRAAEPLLVIAGRIKKISPDMAPLALQNYLITQIQQMETQLQQSNIRAENIMLAKYFMCCFLDDLIQYEWLLSSDAWRMHHLLFYFFQEKNADARMLGLIESLQQEPETNIALIELIYMLLLYGYQGGYRSMPDGHYRFLEKLDELYHILHWQHGDFRKNLFISAQS